MSLPVFPLHAWVRLADTLTVAGVATDDATTVLTIRKAVGSAAEAETTVANASLSHDGTGQYHADVELDVSGIWAYQFLATGAAAGADEQRFYVDASDFA